MDIARANRSRLIHPGRGDVVWVPANAWNRPRWDLPVTVLTLLFGAKQIGISLVQHTGDADVPADTLKASVHGAQDDPTQHVLRALMATILDGARTDATHGVAHGVAHGVRAPLPRLLVESLLHACLRQFTTPGAEVPRKAVRTYEAICLYVQEHYQHEVTRDTVARQFGLAPTHVSRLFRREGLVRFNDYVNLVRVNRAKFLLRTYGMPLKEVAARCGYADVAYFCQVFKRLTMVTPTQYRDVTPPMRPTAPTPTSPAHH
jgi:AraC-like DNA-binding protein